MFDKFFQSANRPFSATPQTRFYYPFESFELARQTVLRSIQRAEGPAMVLGGSGLGKSLLAELIAKELVGRFDVVRLHSARLCSRRALLQNILFELQLPYRDLSEGELRLSILDRLQPSQEWAPEGVAFVVDEANTLPVKLLDELRIINNFTRNGQPRTRLLLIGNLRLEELFSHPRLDSFNQRIAARCYLQPMNRLDTREFVKHQLTVDKYNPASVITDSALDSLYAATEGVPRLVNQIMDHAIMLAATNSQCPVSASLIEEAWADLQQLPAPWHAGTDSGISKGNPIEFGSLDDDEELSSDALDAGSPHTSTQPLPVGVYEARNIVVNSLDSQSNEPEPIYPIAFEQAIAPDTSFDLYQSEAEEKNYSDTLPDMVSMNYFAAFSDVEEEQEYDEEVEVDDSVVPEEVSATNTTQLLPSSVSKAIDQAATERSGQIVFDASSLFGQSRSAVPSIEAENAEIQTEDESFSNDSQLSSVVEGTIDTFFVDRPTDEKMLALSDEQNQFDGQGVWSNGEDFPERRLARINARTDNDVLTGPQGIVSIKTEDLEGDGVAANPPRYSKEELFGSDFDEEESVVALTVEETNIRVDGSSHNSFVAPESLSSATVIPLPMHIEYDETQDEGEQVVIRDQKSAASLFRPGASMSQQLPENALPIWEPLEINTLDSSTYYCLDSEVEIAAEVEDLVSQLNFAAFTVDQQMIEEDIPIVPLKPSGIPDDSVRGGLNDEIYLMHRPQAIGATVFETAADQIQDDRDMLQIEEEIPPSMKNLAKESTNVEDLNSQIVRPQPYSQLFARLRK